MGWTKEQREQAANKVFRRSYGSSDPIVATHWAEESGDDESEWSMGNPKTRLAIFIQCELTAALDEIERLRSQLAKDDTQMGELAVGKWISVKDRKPKHEQEVLIFPRAGGTTAFYGTRWSDRPAFYMYGAVLHEVTHWQPLPAPPSGEQAAKPKKLTLTEAARIASGKDMQPPSKPIRFAAVPVGNQERRDEEGI